MKRIILFSACLLVCMTADAQRQQRNVRNNRAPSLSVGMQLSQPVGEFSAFMQNPTVGLAGALLINNRQSPLEYGIQASWHGLGSTRQDVLLDMGTNPDDVHTFQDASLKLRSNLHSYHGLVRLKPFAGGFQPYGDLMVGAKSFSLKTQLQEKYDGYRETVETNRDHHDLTYSMGWAVGLKLRLNRAVMLEARFENMRGGEVEYVDGDSIQVADDGTYTFETIGTRTSSYNYSLGISFEF